MNPFTRATAVSIAVTSLAAGTFAFVPPVWALPPVVMAAFTPADETAVETEADRLALTLPETEALALTRQPLLEAQAARVRGGREQAVADAQLPDPEFMTGVRDLPISGADAFALDRDNFTMVMAGVRQAFPRSEKRRLMGERRDIEADADELELAAMGREVRREAALAWLDVYYAERALEPARALVEEYEAQLQALEIALMSNRASQADLLAARVERDLARDRVRSLARDVERARAQLARWLGAEAAQRPLPPQLPNLPPPPALEQVLTAVQTHPHLNSFSERVRLAETEIALARQDYKPDWALSLEYGYRARFPDYIGVQFEMGLPLFTGQRQNRRLAARLANAEEMRGQQADVLRQQEAQVRSAYATLQAARERSHEFERSILPQARHRVEAAQLAFESRGVFADLLLARRARLETELLQLEQLVEIARAQVQLRYFTE